MRIPGFAGATGGETICSEAMIPCMSVPLLGVVLWDNEVDVVEVEADFTEASGVIVEVEEEREKVLASGPRCVSLSSAWC